MLVFLIIKYNVYTISLEITGYVTGSTVELAYTHSLGPGCVQNSSDI